MTKHEQAVQLLHMGIATIPLRHRGKEPEASMMGGAWERYKDHLPTEYDLLRWFGSGWQNYGVVCGWDNLAVIDFDNADQYSLWLNYYNQYLMRIYELQCPPYTVQSARGAHVYIRLYGDYYNQRRQGIDVKVHGYVVGAGSVHPTGTQYLAIHPEMHFPQVFDLDTWLPPELFPKLQNEAVLRQIDPLPMTFDNLSNATYDPFAQAARVTDLDLLSTVKSRVRIEHFFPQATKTSADGRWLACACPFHDDNRPSAWIDTRRQLFGCNVCGFRPMDSVNLYARTHNMSDKEAINAMAKECGVWG